MSLYDELSLISGKDIKKEMEEERMAKKAQKQKNGIGANLQRGAKQGAQMGIMQGSSGTNAAVAYTSMDNLDLEDDSPNDDYSFGL